MIGRNSGSASPSIAPAPVRPTAGLAVLERMLGTLLFGAAQGLTAALHTALIGNALAAASLHAEAHPSAQYSDSRT